MSRWTPLFRAAFNGSLEVARLLLPLAPETATTPCSAGDWTPAHVGKPGWLGGWMCARVRRCWVSGWVGGCVSHGAPMGRLPT